MVPERLVLWIAFNVFVLGMLALDLGIFHRKAHAVSIKEASIWSAICKRAPQRGLCVDHCHASGKVRGLLCRKCNMGLGLYDENPEFVRAALAYLEQWRRDP